MLPPHRGTDSLIVHEQLEKKTPYSPHTFLTGCYKDVIVDRALTEKEKTTQFSLTDALVSLYSSLFLVLT